MKTATATKVPTQLINLQPFTSFTGKQFCFHRFSLNGTVMAINIAEKPGFLGTDASQMFSIGQSITLLTEANELHEYAADELIFISPFGNFRVKQSRYHSARCIMGVNWYKNYLMEPLDDAALAQYSVASVKVSPVEAEAADDQEAPVEDVRVGMMICSHLSDLGTGLLDATDIHNRTNFLKWLIQRYPNTDTWVCSDQEWEQFTQTRFFRPHPAEQAEQA